MLRVCYPSDCRERNLGSQQKMRGHMSAPDGWYLVRRNQIERFVFVSNDRASFQSPLPNSEVTPPGLRRSNVDDLAISQTICSTPLGVPPNARQIIDRVFGCFLPQRPESVSPLLAVRTRLVSVRRGSNADGDRYSHRARPSCMDGTASLADRDLYRVARTKRQMVLSPVPGVTQTRLQAGF